MTRFQSGNADSIDAAVGDSGFVSVLVPYFPGDFPAHHLYLVYLSLQYSRYPSSFLVVVLPVLFLSEVATFGGL